MDQHMDKDTILTKAIVFEVMKQIGTDSSILDHINIRIPFTEEIYKNHDNKIKRINGVLFEFSKYVEMLNFYHIAGLSQSAISAIEKGTIKLEKITSEIKVLKQIDEEYLELKSDGVNKKIENDFIALKKKEITCDEYFFNLVSYISVFHSMLGIYFMKKSDSSNKETNASDVINDFMKGM